MRSTQELPVPVRNQAPAGPAQRSGPLDSFFLVLARCSLDDLPLAAFADREAAVTYAGLIDHDSICGLASDVFNLDTSTCHNITVVDFDGGLPVKSEVVRDLES